MEFQDYYQEISDRTGVDYSRVAFLCEYTFDEDIGECISNVTDDGVFVMDIVAASGDYTLLPYEFGYFVQMLENRLNKDLRFKELQTILFQLCLESGVTAGVSCETLYELALDFKNNKKCDITRDSVLSQIMWRYICKVQN